jgi:HK97 family phage major capsid protein
MRSAHSANKIIALFGDLTLAASFGDRRQTEIQISDSALNAFEQDELAIRGTERFDINVHDAGDSSTTGPIVGLLA